MKSTSAINPAIKKYGMLDRLSVCHMYQFESGCVEAPLLAGSALTLVFHQSHNAFTVNHHLWGKGERNEAQWRTKSSFGRTMMQELELLRLAKRHISGQSNVEQSKT